MAVLKAFNWSPRVSKQGFIIKRNRPLKQGGCSELNFKENERSDFCEWNGSSKGQTASGWIEGIAMFCPTACRLIPASGPGNPARLVSGLKELIKVFSSPSSPFLSFGHGTASAEAKGEPVEC